MNTILAAALAAILTGLGGFWYGQGVGHDQAVAKQKSADDLAEAIFDRAQAGAATAISKIEVKNVTIRQKVEREIVENVVYRECRHGPDGLRSVNEALTGRAQPAGGGQLPGSDPAAK